MTMVTQSRTEVLPQSVRSQSPIQAQGPAPRKQVPYVTGPIVRGALADAFRKLDPRLQIRNPVMFVVFAGQHPHDVHRHRRRARHFRSEGPPGFILAIAVWLWLTVLFANFAEAVAEGRGKAQAETLRSMRRHVQSPSRLKRRAARPSTTSWRLAHCGAAISSSSKPTTSFPPTARSSKASRPWTRARSPANRRPCCARRVATSRPSRAARACCRTGSSSASPASQGEAFLDRMIAMVEGAKRGRTPNEIALSILLAMLTLIFLLATATLAPFSRFAVDERRTGSRDQPDRADRAARLPDPDHDRRAALRDRHRRHGPHGSRQRHRDLGSRRRSRGRRRRAAARQDRHDHARRPPGDAFHPGARRHASRNWPTRRNSPRWPTRRPRAARSSCSPSRSSSCAVATSQRRRTSSTSSRRRRA